MTQEEPCRMKCWNEECERNLDGVCWMPESHYWTCWKR